MQGFTLDPEPGLLCGFPRPQHTLSSKAGDGIVCIARRSHGALAIVEYQVFVAGFNILLIGRPTRNIDGRRLPLTFAIQKYLVKARFVVIDGTGKKYRCTITRLDKTPWRQQGQR